MIDLTVKTLDSKNHNFSVPDDFSVKNLKERIADSVNIPADSQRLIYCGRVLQDEKNLSEYDVNGKVIHLVQRAPPTSNGSGPDRGARSQTGTGGTRRTPLRIIGSPGNPNHAMYLGAMAFPTEVMDATGVSMEQPRPCLSQSRLNVVKNMLERTSRVLDRLENPNQSTPESTDGSPENGNSEGSAEEDGGATPLTTPITAAVGIATTTISPTVIVTDPIAGGSSIVVESEPLSPPEPSQAPSAPESEAQTSNPSEPQAPPAQNEGEEASRYPRPQALADLLDQYNTINSRLQPFMNQYQQLLRDDPVFPDQDAASRNRRVFYGVSEVMHNLGHAFHTMSDIMCDFTQTPPRSLRCRPVLIQHSALVQTGIPIQIAASASLFGNQSAASRGATSSSAPAATAPSAADAAESTAATTAESEEQAQTTPSSAAQTPPTSTPETTPTTTQAQGTTTQEQSPLRFRQSGGGGHPGFEIFVDVAPGSITIDSVETHVLNVPISTGTANTTESTDTNMPPDLVQNLISALTGQFLGATMQQYQQQRTTGATPSTTASASTTAGTSTTASTSTTEGLTWASSANAQEAAVNAQNSQARGNTTTNPTTATRTRSTPRPHVHIPVHGLPGNSFDPFLPCNSHHIRRSGTSRRQRVEQTQAREGGANSTSRTETGARANTSRHRPVPMSGHGISISLRADPSSRYRRSTSNVPTTASPTGFPPQLQAIIRSLIASNAPEQGFPAPMSQLLDAFFDGQNNSTLAQILQNVTGYSHTPGESMFTDILMILAQSLTFTDILQLGLGNSECLSRARPQLRELLSQRLLHNQPLSPAGISDIIDRLNAEIATIYPIFEIARFREEIDLLASINSINHQMLPAIFNTTMEEDESTFHRTLVRKCTQYLRLLCALLLHCCLDGATGLEAILTCFVNQMTTGVPRPLQEWTISHSIQNFRSFTGNINVPMDEIRRFIVYRMANPAVSSPQPATTPSANPPAIEPMDVEEAVEVEIESTPSCIREPPVADTPPVNDSIGWQNTLPSEWVPIITRDAQRQRRQSSQGPFSDAYLSGMPSKRRKLITSAKPQGNLSEVISESMASALGAAGMRSGPEVDVIAQRAGQDSNMRTAYKEQVRTTLRHNLNSNPDYLPDKYPNSAKYFKKP